MSKKSIIILISALALVIIICFMFFTNGCINRTYDGDSYDKNIKIMNDNNVSLVIYGDEITFRDGVNYKYINGIDKSSFSGNEFLVVNDRSSNVVLDEEDYIEIKELVSKGVTFMYIGSSKLNTFKEKGFITDQVDNYLGFTLSPTPSASSYGLWSTSHEETFKINSEYLGSTIVSNIVHQLKK